MPGVRQHKDKLEVAWQSKGQVDVDVRVRRGVEVR